MKQLGAVNDWPAWLAERDDANQLERLRRHANKGLPCGADAFIRRLEQIAGRRLECRPQGRPRKVAAGPKKWTQPFLLGKSPARPTQQGRREHS
jgi:hypothetical protein